MVEQTKPKVVEPTEKPKVPAPKVQPKVVEAPKVSKPKVKKLVKLNVAKGFTKNLARTMLVRYSAKCVKETDGVIVYEGPGVIIEVTKL